jgi:hypothetical protein
MEGGGDIPIKCNKYFQAEVKESGGNERKMKMQGRKEEIHEQTRN